MRFQYCTHAKIHNARLLLLQEGEPTWPQTFYGSRHCSRVTHIFRRVRQAPVAVLRHHPHGCIEIETLQLSHIRGKQGEAHSMRVSYDLRPASEAPAPQQHNSRHASNESRKLISNAHTVVVSHLFNSAQAQGWSYPAPPADVFRGLPPTTTTFPLHPRSMTCREDAQKHLE